MFDTEFSISLYSLIRFFIWLLGWGPQDFSVDDCVRNWIDGELFSYNTEL